MGNWKTCSLSDICEINMGQSPKSEYYNNNCEGLPFLQGNRTFGSKYPTFDTYTTFSTKTAEAGDVIMSVRAPVGDVNITPVKMCLGRGICSLRHKDGEQEFLYYLMRYYSKDLIKRESGTVFGSINRNDIAALVISIPPLIEQVEIGQILRALDDKIANNTAINHHLTSTMSETDSSPDIRRGKRVSRRVIRCDISFVCSAISSKIGLTILLKSLNSLIAGTKTGNCLSSPKLIYFCVLPANRISIWFLILGLRKKHNTKYTQSSACEVLNRPTFLMAKFISCSITNEISPIVPIMLIRISCLSTLLRSLILSKSALLIKFGATKSTPNGKRCFEVTSGKPFSTVFGESCVPSRTSISSLIGVCRTSLQGKACA